MVVNPLRDNVLVKLDDTDSTTSGGIVLTNTQKSNRATVMAVGGGLTLPSGNLRFTVVSTGDAVLLNPYAKTTEVEVDGDKLHVIKEDDILAILN